MSAHRVKSTAAARRRLSLAVNIIIIVITQTTHCWAFLQPKQQDLELMRCTRLLRWSSSMYIWEYRISGIILSRATYNIYIENNQTKLTRAVPV